MPDAREVTVASERQLDALIAEHVMGWERRTMIERVLDPAWRIGMGFNAMYKVADPVPFLVAPDTPVDASVGVRAIVGDLRIGGDVPAYSTDANAAMQVVDAMREKKYSWSAQVPKKGDAWASFNYQGTGDPDGQESGSKAADTFCRAICLAALAAVGVRVRFAETGKAGA